jgi:hypothetical protein
VMAGPGHHRLGLEASELLARNGGRAKCQGVHEASGHVVMWTHWLFSTKPQHLFHCDANPEADLLVQVESEMVFRAKMSRLSKCRKVLSG